MSQNNIEKIISFLDLKLKGGLLINQVSNEIGSFYHFVVTYFANKKNINIKLNPEISEMEQIDDLFGQTYLMVFNTTNTKDIEKIKKTSGQNIIITDYKLFKRNQREFLTINGYDYLLDIKFFFKNILEIDNIELSELCMKNPELIYSETSKYLVNKDGYTKDAGISEATKIILELRKSFFKNKNDGNIKNIFNIIKDEALYKKLSFLTY